MMIVFPHSEFGVAFRAADAEEVGGPTMMLPARHSPERLIWKAFRMTMWP
jgi:hypothetical protein